MKKRFLLATMAVWLCAMGTMAQDNPDCATDTILLGVKVRQHETSWDYYRPEVGYFQKAFADESDPRFMIANEDDSFEFGVGGKLRMTGYMDFCGSVEHTRFSTWDIMVPTYRANHFGINVASSNLYFKSRTRIGQRKLISYIAISANDDDKIELDQAYVSYGGLSVGSTYSFFMDLAAGIQLVDLKGINTGISRTHPLIGYTLPVGKHWQFGAAIEQPSLVLGNYEALGIIDEFQSMPDVAFRAMHKGHYGHLQFASLLRTLRYWSADGQFKPGSIDVDGTTKKQVGYGMALSGTINVTPQWFLTFQTLYGKGIQRYVRDCSSQALDLLPADFNAIYSSQDHRMSCTPLYGGYVGMQYKLTPKVTAAAAVGYLAMDLKKVGMPQGMDYDSYMANTRLYDYKSSTYLVANVFYHLNNYCAFGVEFLSGNRRQYERNLTTYELTGRTQRGDAHRLDMMFSYSF